MAGEPPCRRRLTPTRCALLSAHPEAGSQEQPHGHADQKACGAIRDAGEQGDPGVDVQQAGWHRDHGLSKAEAAGGERKGAGQDHVGTGSAIGAGAVVEPGATIGSNSVVGLGLGGSLRRPRRHDGARQPARVVESGLDEGTAVVWPNRSRRPGTGCREPILGSMPSVFTKIASGDIPGHIVYEDDLAFAILDINPRASGHTLVIPRVEVDQLYDLPDDAYRHLWSVARTVATAVRTVTGCERIYTFVIGDEVPHAHIHLIPSNLAGPIPFPPVDHAAVEALPKTADLIQEVLS